MKAVVPVLGCLLIAAEATIACSVVEVVETLPSSPHVLLTVLKDGTPQQNAKLVVTLQANGQQVGPALSTSARGSAELRRLAPGTYCISAAADPRLGAVLCLAVSNAHERKLSEFSLKLVPVPPPQPTLQESLERRAKSSPEIRARAFEGMVTDVTGSPILRAEVFVYAQHSMKKAVLTKSVADGEGRFSVPLNPGSYVAAFQSPGFKKRIVSFEVGPEEPQGPVPIMLQIGECTP
jgi:Carboxypeptidase regulatory-like domain